MIMPVYNIDNSVGQRGVNQSGDVLLVQTMLIEIAKTSPGWAPLSPLTPTGIYTPLLAEWIIAFQTRASSKTPGGVVIDGRVDPMPVKGATDWSASFGGGTKSTMFGLNAILRRDAKAVHTGLADRLGIREVGAT
jgi:hypothetical protein